MEIVVTKARIGKSLPVKSCLELMNSSIAEREVHTLRLLVFAVQKLTYARDALSIPSGSPGTGEVEVRRWSRLISGAS